MTVAAGFTGDSNAPLREVKKVQFGILGPEETVRFYNLKLYMLKFKIIIFDFP